MLNQLFNKLVKGKRDIRIRKAVNADVFELISLIKDIRKAYGLPIDLKKKDQDLLSIDFYYKNGNFLVAEDDGRIVCCAAIFYSKDGSASITKFYVDRFYRKLGLGTELVNMLCAYAEEADQHQIHINIPHRMRAAQKFMRKIGFEKINAKIANSNSSFEKFIKDLRH